MAITPWPEKRVAMLRRLAAQGLSASAIGAAMDLGQNAIVGMCRRRGIRLQGNNNGGGCRTGQVLKSKPVPVVRKRKPVAAPMPVPPPPPAPPPAGECKWLNGSGPPWLYCGAPVRLGRSFCDHHYARVFLRHRERVA